MWSLEQDWGIEEKILNIRLWEIESIKIKPSWLGIREIISRNEVIISQRARVIVRGVKKIIRKLAKESARSVFPRSFNKLRSKSG